MKLVFIEHDYMVLGFHHVSKTKRFKGKLVAKFLYWSIVISY